MYKLIAICVAGFFVSGCSNMLSIGSTEYGCKGMPEGVSCMSAKDVYSATENEDYKTTLQAEQQAAKEASGKIKKVDGEPSTRVLYAEGADNAPIPMRARNPLPIRTQAVVMRIAVDPWEDENGDLYVPGFIYTEIEPRRWEIGARQPDARATLRPLSQ
ncbi:type IV conjugative transfer system lipoprotein TraV [Stutzerimonas stutzeri]|uniref:type IV conjugative transfer system lipoprotein TraV n=1 Tax=Stutzerimonas stutzeri TaxID=316 RepID=UPI0015E44A26|nr:type IV conjugative transfer system lipoprotein TraV [Stutzerimonas stutzeri]